MLCRKKKRGDLMRFGVPYKGSKNQIALEIIDFLPKANTFYDLFCGGCSVSHAAMYRQKYNKIVLNDIDNSAQELFINALNGKYKNESRWISREDFFRLKDDDCYVRWCWSFGNNGKDYLYGADVEEFKHGLHLAIFEKDTRLLEKEMNVERGTIPLFEDVTDVSKRYSLYRNYLKRFYGDDEKHIVSQAYERQMRLNKIGGASSTQDCRPTNDLTPFEGGRLQSLEATKHLGGGEQIKTHIQLQSAEATLRICSLSGTRKG